MFAAPQGYDPQGASAPDRSPASAPTEEPPAATHPRGAHASSEDAPSEDAPSEDRALPDRFADGTMHQLEPSIRTIWMLKLGGFLLLVVGAVFFYELVQWLSADGGAWPAGTLTLGTGVLAAALTFFLPRLRYRYWRYALRPEELYLERGIFNRVRTVVPLRRIQHLDVSQDLFEREFSLGKLVVHTAGGRSSDVAVPGLRYETAERLRDDVKRYVLDDAV